LLCGIARHQRSYGPLRLPVLAIILGDGVGGGTSTRSGSPPYCPDRLPGMLCSLPRRLRSGAHVGSFLALRGLPRNSGGSASATSLSRPARASHELRPARLLTHQKWAWLRGFDPTGCSLGTSGKIARQLPCQPMTTWVAPSSTGDPRRWVALN
jgi:hypothetical protein